MERKIIIIGLGLLWNLFSCQKPKNELAFDKDPFQEAMSLCFVPAGMKWDFSEGKAPLLEGMDLLDFPVSTDNSEARKYFNQGLLLAYAFNHAEAERSFQYAAKLDPDFAMAYWGQAYVLGPNYNAGMEPEHYVLAFTAIQKAKSKLNNVSDKEAAFIMALDKRYVAEVRKDRTDLDIAYAEAMAKVWEKYPDDPDAGTIYSEALMDLQPWDLWDKEGNPKGNTGLILNVLEEVLSKHPDHPGAHHLYIHAVEGSKNPERGLNSARKFDQGLSPMAGHLIHMPSHIYIRTGNYHEGTLSNLRAAKVDSIYIETCKAQGTYPLAYFPHNYHFMAGTAILEGNSKWAIFAADRLFEHLELALMEEEGLEVIQHFSTIPYFVRVKFGLWEEVLNLSLWEKGTDYQEGIRHYAKGMAYLGKNNLQSAERELQLLQEYSKKDYLKEKTIWGINSLQSILEIASLILEGEILASKKSFDAAVMKLYEASKLEDNLLYNEPPDWFLSTRHHLGAVLLESGDYQKAEAVFRKDLEEYPKNGWAYYGLMVALEKSGNAKESEKIKSQFLSAWNTADIKLSSSRIK
ncbi:tetratricopeptide repeat protein [Cecembia rubra]|uniref:Tetratricopeptide repeat protein n=1 Tax=Cecembia rubra TaxID=1485585 RepID=A0A2P8EE14_9BACT|nr:tetratricopeptide repeat protein [Cecembia rubra]PSL07711.1 tetratricopeptide repeat protein [Cecembia rubra]